jgi:uncharacterized membrane protein
LSATTGMPGTPPEALDEGLRLVVPGRSLAAGAGWEWIAAGWKLFARAPLMWIVAIVLLFLVAVATNLVPIVGGLAFQVLQGVFAAGFVAACRSLERGDEFELEHLFAGFTRRFVPLLVLGLLVLLGWIVIMLVFAVFLGFSVLGAMLTGDAEAMAQALMASSGVLILGVLVMLALAIPLMAAYWFAPALILMHDMAPVAAMRASFSASFRNIVPMLVYGVVMLVLAIVAVIPFGLGMLVWVPLMIASTYAAYRQIFTEDAAAAPAAPRMID